MGLISLIFDRFPIRNHRWKAQNPSFYSMVSDLVLLSHPAPLLGRIRHVYLNTCPLVNVSNEISGDIV